MKWLKENWFNWFKWENETFRNWVIAIFIIIAIWAIIIVINMSQTCYCPSSGYHSPY